MQPLHCTNLVGIPHWPDVAETGEPTVTLPHWPDVVETGELPVTITD